MKPIRVLPLAVIVLLGAAMNGCASRSNLPVYDPSQVGTVMRTEKGEIVAVRDVLIKPQGPSNVSVGTVLGAGVGRTATTGNPGPVGGAVGAVIGGAVGAKADERIGEELTIQTEGGRTLIIVQERSDPPLAPGEKIQVITSAPSGPGYPGGGWGGRTSPVGTGGTARVVRERDPRFASAQQ